MKKHLSFCTMLLTCSFFTVVLFQTGSFAAQPGDVAKVIIMRGKAFAIDKDKKEKSIKRGDWIKEGTTIKTKEKSLVKLLFIDKNQINLGPNSQMLVNKYPKKEAGIISLMTGKLRSKSTRDYAKKKEVGKSALFIKTRTAAMGVRGTEFIASFDEKKMATSLIVIAGKVTLAPTKSIERRSERIRRRKRKGPKGPDRTADQTGQEKTGEAPTDDPAPTPDEQAPTEEVITEEAPTEEAPIVDQTQLDDLLDNSGVPVEEGEFSGTSATMEKALEPIKLSPIQMENFKRDENMTGEKAVRDPIPAGVSKETFQNKNEEVQAQVTEVVMEQIAESEPGTEKVTQEQAFEVLTTAVEEIVTAEKIAETTAAAEEGRTTASVEKVTDTAETKKPEVTMTDAPTEAPQEKAEATAETAEFFDNFVDSYTEPEVADESGFDAFNLDSSNNSGPDGFEGPSDETTDEEFFEEEEEEEELDIATPDIENTTVTKTNINFIINAE